MTAAEVGCADPARHDILDGMVRAVLWTWLLAGCGRFAFDAVPTADAADADAADPDAAAGPDALVPCGGTSHLLTDDFDDGVFDPATWGNAFAAGTSTYAETGGRFVVTVPAGEGSYAGYESTDAYDLREDRAFVEVARVPVQSVALLQVFATPGTTLGLAVEYERGILLARKRESGLTVLADLPYDPVAHRWWQVREKAGVVYFETSPDGAAWTTFHQMATPFDLSASYLTLSAGGNNSGVVQTAEFDDFNGGGAPPACF